MLQCPYTIWLSTIKIIERQPVVCGIITDEVTDGRNDNDFVNKNIINWESFLNTRQVLQEVLIMLMKKLPMQRVMKLIILLMMQTKLVKKKLKLLFH